MPVLPADIAIAFVLVRVRGRENEREREEAGRTAYRYNLYVYASHVNYKCISAFFFQVHPAISFIYFIW